MTSMGEQIKTAVITSAVTALVTATLFFAGGYIRDFFTSKINISYEYGSIDLPTDIKGLFPKPSSAKAALSYYQSSTLTSHSTETDFRSQYDLEQYVSYLQRLSSIFEKNKDTFNDYNELGNIEYYKVKIENDTDQTYNKVSFPADEKFNIVSNRKNIDRELNVISINNILPGEMISVILTRLQPYASGSSGNSLIFTGDGKRINSTNTSSENYYFSDKAVPSLISIIITIFIASILLSGIISLIVNILNSNTNIRRNLQDEQALSRMKEDIKFHEMKRDKLQLEPSITPKTDDDTS